MLPDKCLRCGYVDFYYPLRYSLGHEIALRDKHILEDLGAGQVIISEEEHERRRAKGLE